MNPSKAIAKELMSIPDFSSSNGSELSQEIKMVKNFKKALLLVAGISVKKLGENIAKEQEVLMNIADIINTIYLCESTLLRVQKVGNYENYKEQLNMLKVLVYDSCDVVNKAGKDIVYTICDGDESKMMILGLKRFTKHEGLDTIELRRQIAKKVIDKNKYCF